MSRPPLIEPNTASGITSRPSRRQTNGQPSSEERVIPTTLRPDGTARRERRVRPGYVPMEDMTRFKTSKAAEAESIGDDRGFGGIVGLAPRPDSMSTMSKAQKKNEKRKAKKKEEGGTPEIWDESDGGEKVETNDFVDPWDDEPKPKKEDGAGVTSPIQEPSPQQSKAKKPPRSLFQSSIAAAAASSASPQVPAGALGLTKDKKEPSHEEARRREVGHNGLAGESDNQELRDLRSKVETLKVAK